MLDLTLSPEERDVLVRVGRHRPLCQADHRPVLNLIRGGLMHVTPEFNRLDKCPYRLTEAGQAALRARP